MSNQNLNSLNVKTLNFTGSNIYHRGRPIQSFPIDASGAGHGGMLCLDHLGVGPTAPPCPNPLYNLDVSGATRINGALDLSSVDITINAVLTGNIDANLTNSTVGLTNSTVGLTSSTLDISGIGTTVDISGYTTFGGILDASKSKMLFGGPMYDSKGIWANFHHQVPVSTSAGWEWMDVSGSVLNVSIWSKSPNPIENAIYFDASGHPGFGRVGIDTQDPRTSLDVSGTITCNQLDVSGLDFQNQIGSFTSITGALHTNSTAIGINCLASGSYSTAMGNGGFAGPSGSDEIQFAIGVSGAAATTASSSNNNNALVILDTGNVGIGTDNPTTTLDVSGSLLVGTGTLNSTSSAMIGDDNTMTGHPDYLDNSNFIAGHDCSLNGWCCSALGRHCVVNFPLYRGGDQGVALGNFAYAGTKTGKDIAFAIGVGEESSTQSESATATNNNNKFVIDQSGNVGIDTDSPSEKLDVSGNVKIRGYLDMSCNSIRDVSSISFCNGMFLFDASGIDMSCNSIRDVSSITFCGHDGVGIDLSCNTIIDVSGIYFCDGSSFTHGDSLDISGDGISFLTNGTEQMKILSDGNVGIGTTTPSEKLDVSGNVVIQGTLDMSCNRIIDISGISFCSDASGIDMSCNSIRDVSSITFCGHDGVGIDLSCNTIIDVSGIYFCDGSSFTHGDSLDISGDGISFLTNGTEQMKILSYGNVGIGTQAPSEKLDVSGNVVIHNGHLDMSCNRIIDISGISFCHDASGIDMSCNSIRDVSSITFCGHDGVGIDLSCNTIIDVSGIYFCDGSSFTHGDSLDISGDGISFLTNGTEQMTILSDGNVGIGTNSPTYLLDVSGSMGINDYIYHNDNASSYFGFLSDDAFQIVNSSGSKLLINESVEVSINGTWQAEFTPAALTLNGSGAPYTITTASPGDPLTINPNGTGQLTLGSVSGGTTALKGDAVTITSATTTTVTTTSHNNIALMPDGTGGVGIGTTSPANKLTVAGAMMIGSGTSFGGGPTLAPLNGLTVEGNVAIGTSTSIGKLLNVNGASWFSGNMGIGTATPSSSDGLDIQTNSNCPVPPNNGGYLGPYSLVISGGTGSAGTGRGIAFDMAGEASSGETTRTPGGAILYQRTGTYNGKLHFKVKELDLINASCPPVMTLNNTGNVGIGTTTPSEKLDVSGNTTVSGNLQLNGGDITNAIVAHPNRIFATSTGLTTLGGGAVNIGGPGNTTTIDGSLTVDEALTVTSTSKLEGAVKVESSIDTIVPNDLDLGTNTATGVYISKAGATTTINGTLTLSSLEINDAHILSTSVSTGDNIILDPSNGTTNLIGTVTVPYPTDDFNPTTKQYVDSLISGLTTIEYVYLATTDGSSVDLLLTPINVVIDGVALTAVDVSRVLIKNQQLPTHDASENGVWIANGPLSKWTRANDFTDGSNCAGYHVFVDGGIDNLHTGWVVKHDGLNPVIVGSDPIIFNKFSSTGDIKAGRGLEKQGETLNIKACPLNDNYNFQGNVTLNNNTLTLNPTSGTINNTSIGATTTSTGAFTNLNATIDTSLNKLSSTGVTSLATGGGAVNISKTSVLTTVKGTLKVDEAVTLATTLGVTGITTLTNNLILNGGHITNATVGNPNSIFATSTGLTTLGWGAVNIGAPGSTTTIKGSLTSDGSLRITDIVSATGNSAMTIADTGVTTLTNNLILNGGAITNASIGATNNIFATSTGLTTLGGGDVDVGVWGSATTIKGTLKVVQPLWINDIRSATGNPAITIAVDGDVTIATGKNLSITGGGFGYVVDVGAALVPVGCIMMWAMTGNIPANWLLCDGNPIPSPAGGGIYPLKSNFGQTNTPNFTNKFPFGAGNSYTVNTSGGSQTIGSGQLPAHTHQVPISAAIDVDNIEHHHNYDYETVSYGLTTANGVNGTIASVPYNASLPASHTGNTNNTTYANTPTVTVPAHSTGPFGDGDPYLPPYIAVNYIIYAGKPT